MFCFITYYFNFIADPLTVIALHQISYSPPKVIKVSNCSQFFSCNRIEIIQDLSCRINVWSQALTPFKRLSYQHTFGSSCLHISKLCISWSHSKNKQLFFFNLLQTINVSGPLSLLPLWLQIKQFIFWPWPMFFSLFVPTFSPASGGQSGPQRSLFLFGTNWQEATVPN